MVKGDMAQHRYQYSKNNTNQFPKDGNNLLVIALKECESISRLFTGRPLHLLSFQPVQTGIIIALLNQSLTSLSRHTI